MITPNDFKQWLGYSLPGSPGTEAVGLLQITKASGRENQSFSIPKDSIFSAKGLQFKNPEAWQVSESRSDPLDIAVRSESVGVAGNLPSGQHWNSPVSGLLVTNPAAFSLGADPIPDTPGLYPSDQKLEPSDSLLQLHIDTAIMMVRDIIGLLDTETIPSDDPRVKQAIFLLAMYRLENNSSQQKGRNVPDEFETNPQVTSYFRAKVYEPLLMQVRGLVSHLINWKRQINGISGEAANAQSIRFYRAKA